MTTSPAAKRTPIAETLQCSRSNRKETRPKAPRANVSRYARTRAAAAASLAQTLICARSNDWPDTTNAGEFDSAGGSSVLTEFLGRCDAERQENHAQHQEQNKQDLRYAGRTGRDAGKAEQTRDD